MAVDRCISGYTAVLASTILTRPADYHGKAMAVPPVKQLLARALFPEVGVRIHVNHPQHDGDTPLHDHDFLELAIITAGRAVHRTVHGEESVKVGDVLVLHPGQWHAYERCHGLTLYNCCISVEVLSRELHWTRHDPQLARLIPARLPVAVGERPDAAQGVLRLRLTNEQLRSCSEELSRLRTLLDQRDTCMARPEIIARVTLVLGIIAQRLVSPSSVDPEQTGVDDPPVSRIMQAMEGDLARIWSLADCAKIAGINRFHVVRQFNRHVGCAPMIWLLRRRAEKAAVLLLTTDLPIADIGQQVGWPDANYFSRRFRAAFGMSPSNYRGQLPMPAMVRDSEDWVQW